MAPIDPSSPHPAPFDPRLRRLRRRRAAPGFATAAFLHQRVAEDLAERLSGINRTFSRAVAWGGDGLFRAALETRPEAGAKIGALHEAEIVFDPEALPFRPASLDLFVAVLGLHWINDLPGALIQIRRALRPDGLFLGAALGGNTLTELRACLLQAELERAGGAALRVAPLADARDYGALLQRAGFALPVTDVDRAQARYAHPLRLLADLRAMGETATLRDRPPRLRRDALFRAMELYQQDYSDPDGRARATFEIIHLSGWAPHESQPRPLRPGSAKARLADALKEIERGLEPDDAAGS